MEVRLLPGVPNLKEKVMMDRGTKYAMLWSLTILGYSLTALSLGWGLHYQNFGILFLTSFLLSLTIFVNNKALE